jgi:predicted sulfurtransferase
MLTEEVELVPDKDWLIVLFYQFTCLENPGSTCLEQLQLCNSLDLKGRVRVSPEVCTIPHAEYRLLYKYYVQYMANNS